MKLDSLCRIAFAAVSFKSTYGFQENDASQDLVSFVDCPPEPAPDAPCIPIESYSDLRKEIQTTSSGEGKVFCEFLVFKDQNEVPVVIENLTDVTFRCRKFNKCSISGQGSHLNFSGDQVKAILQGFTFHGATKNSVEIHKEAQAYEQKICHCDFRE